MTSTNSSSKRLIIFKDTLKRYWMIPVAMFAVYGYMVIAPLLMRVDQGDSAYLLYTTISNNNFLTYFLNACLSFAVGLAVMYYIHGQESSQLYHALPVKREDLFDGSVLAGVVMCVAPIVVVGLILGIIATSTPEPILKILIQDYGVKAVPKFTDAFSWIGVSSVCTLFSYAIMVLAGILSGHTVAHMLYGSFLNVAPALITMIDYLLVRAFARGVISNGIRMELAIYTTPYFYYLSRGHSAMAAVAYIGAALVIIAVTRLLLKKLPMEEEGNFSIFKLGTLVIATMVAYVGSVLLTEFFLILCNVSDTAVYIKPLFVILCIFFSFVILCILYMIATKSTQIFTKKYLKPICIGLAVIGIAVGSSVYDIRGNEGYIPSVRKVNNVSIIIDVDRYSESLNFKSADMIQKVEDIHKRCLELNEPENGDYSRTVEINYSMNNGDVISRQYFVLEEDIKKNVSVFTTVYESKEAVKQKQIDMKSLEGQPILLSIDRKDGTTNTPQLKKTQEKEFIEAYNKDVEKLIYNFDETVKKGFSTDLADTQLEFQTGHEYKNTYHVYKDYTNTLNLLKKYKYIDDKGYSL